MGRYTAGAYDQLEEARRKQTARQADSTPGATAADDFGSIMATIDRPLLTAEPEPGPEGELEAEHASEEPQSTILSSAVAGASPPSVQSACSAPVASTEEALKRQVR